MPWSCRLFIHVFVYVLREAAGFSLAVRECRSLKGLLVYCMIGTSHPGITCIITFGRLVTQMRWWCKAGGGEGRVR